MSEKITPADAIRLLDAGKAVAVDVREPDEFAVGHIPGAKLLPLGSVLSRAAEVLPEKDAAWLIYCRTGRRSADAVQKLESLGYTQLYDLGGILSWPYEIEGDFDCQSFHVLSYILRHLPVNIAAILKRVCYTVNVNNLGIHAKLHRIYKTHVKIFFRFFFRSALIQKKPG